MKKIIVVDDESIIAVQLEELLQAGGYQVAGIAANGEEGVAMAFTLQPDLILMDIVMPGKLDGIAAASAIKAKLDVPIVFLTAFADDESIRQAKMVEPAGFVLKPFREREVVAAVEIALHMKESATSARAMAKKYQSLYAIRNHAVITIDNRRTIKSWSAEAQKLFGYSSEEIVGQRFNMLVARRVIDKLDHALNSLHMGEKEVKIGQIIELAGMCKDGREFPLEISLAMWKLPNEIVYSCIARDCTDKKLASEEISSSLQSKESFFQDLHKQLSQSILDKES